MLTDQTFMPSPIVGLGPEIFYSPSVRSGVDYSAFHRLQKFALRRNGIGVRYVYVGLRQTSYFQDLSMLISHFNLFGLISEKFLFDSPSDIEQFRALLESMVAVYSPELIGSAFISTALNCSKEDFFVSLESYIITGQFPNAIYAH